VSSKAGIIALVSAGVVFVHANASAQSAQVSADSLRASRQFVQRFYDWYMPLALGRHAFPAEYYVLSNAGRYLDRDLAAALRADSVAEQAGPSKATRQTLEFDPFLESQDPCGPYEVVDVARRGDAFRVRMRPCHAKGVGPVVEVRAMEGRWRITNVLYDNGDLKSYLCQWAKADLLPDKRPAKC
jgi:hypothetical protein